VFYLSEMRSLNFPLLIQEIFIKFITVLDLLVCFSLKVKM
jgi:hypothetical protein